MEDGCCSGLLRIRHGRVDALLPAEQIPDGPVIDARDARVIPGIIDTHNHGTCGWSLEHPRGFAQDVETVCRYVKACASQGITGVFPTAVPAMISACAQAAALHPVGAEICGIHSEGPWLARSGEGEGGTEEDVPPANEPPAVLVSRPTNQPRHRSLHGLYRALINNMVVGVSKGYEIKQELVGVGFKAEVKGQILEMSLGYSHDTHFMLPKEVTATAVTEKKGNPIVTLKSMDKQLVGQVAAKIRSLRKPEPYKGKGIKFVGEQLRRKAGKSAGAK